MEKDQTSHLTPSEKARITRAARLFALRTNRYAYFGVLALLFALSLYHGYILFWPPPMSASIPNELVIGQVNAAQINCGPESKTVFGIAHPLFLFTQPILFFGILTSILFLVSRMLLRQTREGSRTVVRNVLLLATAVAILIIARIEQHYIDLRQTQLVALTEPARIRLTKDSLIIPVVALEPRTSKTGAVDLPDSIVKPIIHANQSDLVLARDAIQEVTWGFDTWGRKGRAYRYYYRIVSAEYPDNDIKILRHAEIEAALYQLMKSTAGKARLVPGHGGFLSPASRNRVSFNCPRA